MSLLLMSEQPAVCGSDEQPVEGHGEALLEGHHPRSRRAPASDGPVRGIDRGRSLGARGLERVLGVGDGGQRAGLPGAVARELHDGQLGQGRSVGAVRTARTHAREPVHASLDPRLVRDVERDERVDLADDLLREIGRGGDGAEENPDAAAGFEAPGEPSRGVETRAEGDVRAVEAEVGDAALRQEGSHRVERLGGRRHDERRATLHPQPRDQEVQRPELARPLHVTRAQRPQFAKGARIIVARERTTEYFDVPLLEQRGLGPGHDQGFIHAKLSAAVHVKVSHAAQRRHPLQTAADTAPLLLERLGVHELGPVAVVVGIDRVHRVEDVGEEEVQQRPELVEVVLERRARQQQRVLEVEAAHGLADVARLVFDDVALVQDHVAPPHLAPEHGLHGLALGSSFDCSERWST